MKKKKEKTKKDFSVVKSIIGEALSQIEQSKARLTYKTEAGETKIYIVFGVKENNPLKEFYNSECFLSIKDKWVRRSSVFILYRDYAGKEAVGRGRFWNVFRRDNEYQVKEVHGIKQIYIGG